MWDIIGDIHGEAGKLKALLGELGYRETKQYLYEHPTRKVCFLGDYIDRGEEILESLMIVRTMSEHGSAVALMGNHEFNYLAYFTKRKQPPSASKRSSDARPSRPLVYVRRHNARHTGEIRKTYKCFKTLADKGASFVKWMYQLPLYVQTSGFRAIHAVWDELAIKTLNASPWVSAQNQLSKALIENFHNDTSTRLALARILKGVTLDLPKGVTYQAFDDDISDAREYARLAWWNAASLTSEESLAPLLVMKTSEAARIARVFDAATVREVHRDLPRYPATADPLFIGHYWLEQENIAAFRERLREGGRPYLLQPNICCLDFSAAKGGPLVAYRFDGEKVLSEENFVWV